MLLAEPCPYLPSAPAEMDASALSAHGKDRSGPFYLTALTYAQYLWQRGIVARAILKIDRALGANLCGDEPVLREWPMPYSAMAWVLRHAPLDVFMGNPRVHFQHLADRMNEPRREQRSGRIWACWAISRIVLPDLPDDPKHEVAEPSLEKIAEKLQAHGIPGEVEIWRTALAEARERGPISRPLWDYSN